METVKKIEEIAKVLSLDQIWSKNVITNSIYKEVIRSNKDLVEKLTGISSKENEILWDDFKKYMQSYMRQYGYHFMFAQGQYGPLKLDKIDLPDTVGIELAQKKLRDVVFANDSKNPEDYKKLIESEFENLLLFIKKFEYFQKNFFSFEKSANCFSEWKDEKGFRFSFVTNSYKFRRVKSEFEYKSEKSKDQEYELGNDIKQYLKSTLKLNRLYHSQKGRSRGKYLNADFVGFKIVKGIKSDEIEFVNFELKPTNKIADFSAAISQAINYKKSANRTYIIIPLIDQYSFHDSIRHMDFIDLCKENGIGLINIDIIVNEEKHEIRGVSIILEAPFREISDYDEILSAKESLKNPKEEDDKSYEYCQLCKRFVSDDDGRSDCDWRIQVNNEESKCAKRLINDVLSNELLLKYIKTATSFDI